MPVYIHYGSGWLMLKEVYTLRTTSRRGRQTRSAPYGMVAVSVDKLNLKEYPYVDEVEVPASKVSKFAARIHLASTTALVVIEPRGEDYVAKLYGRTRREVEEAKRVALEILRDLQKRRERAEEQVGTEEGVEE